MAAGMIRLLLLLLCVSLLQRSAQSIRPLADAALLLPASSAQLGQRGLLSLVSEYTFDSEVKVAVAAASTRRNLGKKTNPSPSPPPQSTSSPPPPVPQTAVPPPPGVHSDWVVEGY